LTDQNGGRDAIKLLNFTESLMLHYFCYEQVNVIQWLSPQQQYVHQCNIGRMLRHLISSLVTYGCLAWYTGWRTKTVAKSEAEVNQTKYIFFSVSKHLL